MSNNKIQTKRFMLTLLSAWTLTLFSHSAQAKPEIRTNLTQAESNGTQVNTTSGRVQGRIEDDVLTYQGIPYATAERFMPPAPVKKWSGTLLANHYGDICPQTAQNPFPGASPKMPQSEDCLNLNVWTPAVNDGKKRTVMVWLHGGGFFGGSSMEALDYEGKNLSKSGDVVVVSVNHRLNALGYLDLSAYGRPYQYSANVGMMDLVAALQWVKQNIAQFGGNPNNVTIFGESGGGAKVLTLMATPAAKGLFHKAIVESGAVESMGMNLTDPKAGQRVAALTLQALNLKPSELNRLKEVPYETLANATVGALKQAGEELKLPLVRGSGFGMDWTPTMDGKYIPVQPVGRSFAAQSKNVPLLIGTNLNEWETIPEMMTRDKLQSDNKSVWNNDQVQAKLTAKYGAKAPAITAAFLKAYPNKKAVDALYVDTFLRIPAIKTANLKADQKAAPVYSYVFTWETPAFGGFGMAYHTAEIPFVFNNISITKDITGQSPEAYALAKTMSQAWVNFAKTGQPKAEGLPRWTPYTRQNGATMIFDNESKEKYHHDADLMKLLTSK